MQTVRITENQEGNNDIYAKIVEKVLHKRKLYFWNKIKSIAAVWLSMNQIEKLIGVSALKWIRMLAK